MIVVTNGYLYEYILLLLSPSTSNVYMGDMLLLLSLKDVNGMATPQDKNISPIRNFGGKVVKRTDRRCKAGSRVTVPLSIDIDLLQKVMKHSQGDRSKTINYYVIAGLKAEGIEVATR